MTTNTADHESGSTGGQSTANVDHSRCWGPTVTGHQRGLQKCPFEAPHLQVITCASSNLVSLEYASLLC